MRELIDKILAGRKISREEAETLWGMDLVDLFKGATKIREYFSGKKVHLCAVVNAKSGRCHEDCSFCAQSAHHKNNIQSFPLISNEDILTRAREARSIRAGRFGIVISGKGISNDDELQAICDAVSGMREGVSINRCASLGVLGQEQIDALYKAGLRRYHHNLETSESFFPNICTTHTFKERVRTVEFAKAAGFEVCCGGLFGLGESNDDVLDLAFTIRDLGADSVPINFLNPAPGTRTANIPLMDPLKALRIIAIFRFILPDKEIKVCGGREAVLRSLQPLLFYAGANGMMIGNYLTTSGQNPKDDLRMIRDLGLEVDNEFFG